MFHISNRMIQLVKRGACVCQPIAVIRATGVLGEQISAQWALARSCGPIQNRNGVAQPKINADTIAAAYHQQASSPARCE